MSAADHETMPGSSRPPESHGRWLADASDVELCRAYLEEHREFLPSALDGVRREIERRGLDPERILRDAPTIRRSFAERRRLLFCVLAVTIVGLIMGLLPRERSVEVLVYLDNPGFDVVRVIIGDGVHGIEAGASLHIPVRVAVEERPLLSWFRSAIPWEERARAQLEVPVEARSRSGTLVGQWTLATTEGGRVLICLEPGTAYKLITRTYEVRGAIAVRRGPDRVREVTFESTAWDLDGVPLGDGVLTRARFEGSLPPALEADDEAPEGAIMTRSLLTRH